MDPIPPELLPHRGLTALELTRFRARHGRLLAQAAAFVLLAPCALYAPVGLTRLLAGRGSPGLDAFRLVFGLFCWLLFLPGSLLAARDRFAVAVKLGRDQRDRRVVRARDGEAIRETLAESGLAV